MKDEEVLALLDERLLTLWSSNLNDALEFAVALYAPDGDDELAREEIAEQASTHFWRLVINEHPHPPATREERYHALLVAVWRLLKFTRENPAEPFVEEWLAVALRPIRKLRLGALSSEVCIALRDYYRGVWSPHLTKPQLYVIAQALAKTVAALPPDDMAAFWEHLQSEDPTSRNAMLLGLQYLRSAHAVPHLLHGLEHGTDHAIRTAIVDCLEQIAEPSAIATLIRLRRETASTNWTLSRQLARAIRVIEFQNRGQHHRTLLRPAYDPPDLERSLLRPAAQSSRDAAALDSLLRPTIAEREKGRRGEGENR